MTVDQLVELGIFAGTMIAAAYSYITSRKTKQRLKPLEERDDEQSQKMDVIKKVADDAASEVQQLKEENELLKESRESRGQEIAELKAEQARDAERLERLENRVKELTDEKAEVVRERNELQTKLTRAESEIQNLNIRIITLEAQYTAEKNASERIVQPIVDALAKLALSTHDTGKLNPAALDHAPDANVDKGAA